MTHTRKHQKRQKGGSEEDDLCRLNPSDPSCGPPSEPEAQGGGGKRGGRRRSRARGRGSRRSSDGGSRKGGRRKGGRRSRRGGFLNGLGVMLNEAIVPLGLSYYTVKKSRRNRRSRGGRDDIA